MHAITSRRMVSLVASAALISALTVGVMASTSAAAPSEQQIAARQARAEARAQAKAARAADKEARTEAHAQARTAREAAKEARTAARAEAKAAREAASADGNEKVIVCHKPGTPAEDTLEIALPALPAHLAHGDSEGACETTTSALTMDGCPEADASDPETSGEDAACEEPPQVEVSIDAPESIDPQETLQLEASVTAPETADLSYSWSSTCLSDEELVDPTIITSEPGTDLLVLPGNTLTAGTTCDFTLTVTDAVSGEVGSATVTVEVADPT